MHSLLQPDGWRKKQNYGISSGWGPEGSLSDWDEDKTVSKRSHTALAQRQVWGPKNTQKHREHGLMIRRAHRASLLHCGKAAQSNLNSPAVGKADGLKDVRNDSMWGWVSAQMLAPGHCHK